MYDLHNNNNNNNNNNARHMHDKKLQHSISLTKQLLIMLYLHPILISTDLLPINNVGQQDTSKIVKIKF